MTDDETALRGALVELSKHVHEFDYSRSPAEISYQALMTVQGYLGVDDPYREEKLLYNTRILALEGDLRGLIDAAADPLHTAVKLAVAGNIIDLGIIGEFDLDAHIGKALDVGLKIDEYPLLRARLDAARSIIYVLDNAGEVVFDKLLIEQLGGERVTAVVRRKPVLNDVTMADAVQVGVDRICEVIDTGCDIFGVPIRNASEAFRRRFYAADVVISKGQANYETLEDCGREVFFILMAKCPAVARKLGVEVHDCVLKHQAGGR